MLFEKRDAIEVRQAAARCWLEAYAAKHIYGESKHERALAVLVLTHKTSDYLAEFDPQALKQAQLALDVTSWEDFVGRKPARIARGFG